MSPYGNGHMHPYGYGPGHGQHGFQPIGSPQTATAQARAMLWQN